MQPYIPLHYIKKNRRPSLVDLASSIIFLSHRIRVCRYSISLQWLPSTLVGRSISQFLRCYIPLARQIEKYRDTRIGMYYWEKWR
ncbi:hypothetical protein VNO77_02177 [Canavalia gladiata]|uniref:Uncharacterized protein n=1 Tax=Canavalia gladiata TaxID=3824 RepID=A0AAN9MSK1_CANGL